MELVSVSTTVGAPGVGGGGPGVGVSPAGGSEPPEVHSDEVYCMDYISDMKVSDATQLTAQGGLLFIQDTWKPDWEKPIQVSIAPVNTPPSIAHVLHMTHTRNSCPYKFVISSFGS